MTETLHNIAAGLHGRYLDGDLDPPAASWLAEHRARCAACDQSFATLERLTRALEGLDRPEPHPGFADRVLAQVRPAPAPAWARWQLSTTWRRAAAVALLLSGALAALMLPLLVPLVGSQVGPASLFRGPDLLVQWLVAGIREAQPLLSLAQVTSVVAGALAKAALAPPVLLGLGASALLSAGTLLPLSRLLAGQAVPRRV
jgi:hypothetical protein